MFGVIVLFSNSVVKFVVILYVVLQSFLLRKRAIFAEEKSQKTN